MTTLIRKFTLLHEKFYESNILSISSQSILLMTLPDDDTEILPVSPSRGSGIGSSLVLCGLGVDSFEVTKLLIKLKAS